MTVLGLTLVSVLVAIVDPSVAGAVQPHPTLTGSLSDWLLILIDNVRVLAAPFLLGLLGLPTSRFGRSIGDLVVLALIAVNVIPVGLELGRWGGKLLQYLPQLPFEWGALITALSAWLAIRRGKATRRDITVLAVVTAMLLLAAASLETWVTPHLARQTATSQTQVHAVHRATLSCGCPGVCFRHGFCAGPAGPLQGRALPSPHTARFRSAGSRR